MAKAKSVPKARKTRAIILWNDAASKTGWNLQSALAKEEAILCETMGNIISQNKRRIVVAGTISSTGEGNNVMIIPRKMVRGIQYINLKI